MSESASQSGGVARTHAVVALKLVLIDNFSGHHNPDLALKLGAFIESAAVPSIDLLVGDYSRAGRHHEAPAPIAQEAEPATACGAYETAATVTRKGAASGPRSRARRFTLAGFLFSPRARTKAQFNGVGRLRTYISFTHSVF